MNKVWLIFFAVIFACSNLLAIEIDTEQLFLSQLKKNTVPSEFSHSLIVRDSQQLYQAIKQANRDGHTLISIAPGRYYLPTAITILGQNISIIGDELNPLSTVLHGTGMKPTSGVDNLFRVSGDNFTLTGVTLEQAGNHLVQVAGEEGVSGIHIKNCVFQDSYQQLFKVSYNFNQPKNFAAYGVIENSLFRYTAGIGPNYYIGGIDAHAVKHWQIKNNIFDAIASPSDDIAEHAIHLWNNAAHNIVDNNIIINSDRGIGFGMQNNQGKNYKYGNLGGQISNNLIYHSENNHPFADTGISIEQSPETNIIKNVVLLEHNYRNAIEYRFKQTRDVLIANNTTNKLIQSRNGGSAIVLSNTIDYTKTKTIIKTKLADFID